MENTAQNENVETKPTGVITGANTNPFHTISERIAKFYDANAVQTVVIDVNDDGEEFKIEHTFQPHSDEHFFQFDEKRETLLKTNERNKKIVLKNKATEAYLWFWNLFCSTVSGYGEPDQALPDNWKELVPEEDKINAVQGLFMAQIIPQKKTESKGFLPWNRRQGKDYLLEVLFDGEVLEVTHRLGAKTAELTSDWQDLTGSVEFENGRLLENKQEMSIPASAREKVPFFDKLVESSTGYKGRIPAFIKLLIVNDYFSATGSTGKKRNASATQ